MNLDLAAYSFPPFMQQAFMQQARPCSSGVGQPLAARVSGKLRVLAGEEPPMQALQHEPYITDAPTWLLNMTLAFSQHQRNVAPAAASGKAPFSNANVLASGIFT